MTVKGLLVRHGENVRMTVTSWKAQRRKVKVAVVYWKALG